MQLLTTLLLGLFLLSFIAIIDRRLDYIGPELCLGLKLTVLDCFYQVNLPSKSVQHTPISTFYDFSWIQLKKNPLYLS